MREICGNPTVMKSLDGHEKKMRNELWLWLSLGSFLAWNYVLTRIIERRKGQQHFDMQMIHSDRSTRLWRTWEELKWNKSNSLSWLSFSKNEQTKFFEKLERILKMNEKKDTHRYLIIKRFCENAEELNFILKNVLNNSKAWNDFFSKIHNVFCGLSEIFERKV